MGTSISTTTFSTVCTIFEELYSRRCCRCVDILPTTANCCDCIFSLHICFVSSYFISKLTFFPFLFIASIPCGSMATFVHFFSVLVHNNLNFATEPRNRPLLPLFTFVLLF